MYVWFRGLVVLGQALAAPRRGLLEDSVITLHVGVPDIDSNMHMNNGRYLTVMDLGRLDMLFRAGLFRQVVKRKWRPMLASATIRYLHPIQPFRRYQLRTRLVWWDEKWVYMEQRFERKGRVVAISHVKGVIRDPHGNVPPAEIAALAGESPEPPPMPPGLAQWIAWEDAALTHLK